MYVLHNKGSSTEETFPEFFPSWERTCTPLYLLWSSWEWGGIICEGQTKRPGPIKRLNYKIRMLPLSQPDHQHHSAGFCLMAMHYSWQYCKMQSLSEEEHLGKHKVKREDKNKDSGRLWNFSYVQLQQTSNTAQVLARLLYILIACLLTSFLISDTICVVFFLVFLKYILLIFL